MTGVYLQFTRGPPYFYIDIKIHCHLSFIIELSLFSVSQSWRKQKMDPVDQCITKLGHSIFLCVSEKYSYVFNMQSETVSLGRIQLRSISMQTKCIWARRMQLKIPFYFTHLPDWPQQAFESQPCSSQSALLSRHKTSQELPYLVPFYVVPSSRSAFSVDLHKARFFSSCKSQFKYHLKEDFSKHPF